MASPVVWFEIIGKDTNKLRKFYGDVFSWKLAPPVPEMGNYSMLDNEGHGISGGIGEGPDRITIYLEVGDPQAYLDKVERAGGKTLMPVTQITDEVTIAMFADPEGHVTGTAKCRTPSMRHLARAQARATVPRQGLCPRSAS